MSVEQKSNASRMTFLYPFVPCGGTTCQVSEAVSTCAERSTTGENAAFRICPPEGRRPGGRAGPGPVLFGVRAGAGAEAGFPRPGQGPVQGQAHQPRDRDLPREGPVPEGLVERQGPRRRVVQ